MKFEPYTRRELFEHIPELENKTVLDLGSGAFCLYGLEYISLLANKLGKDDINRYENNVVAVDLEYDPYFGGFLDSNLIRSDAKNLPIQNQKFDIVAAGRILNYFRKNYNQLSKALDEIERILKPKGYLMGDITLYPSLASNKILRILKVSLAWGLYMWKIDDYSKLMEKKGFKFLRKGIGLIPKEATNHLKMFFVAQKNENFSPLSY